MLDEMDWRDWSRPSLAVDIAVLTVRPTEVGPQLALLVLQRETRVYRGEWDIPGAFVQERERLSDTVRRALSDKAGISDLAPVELGVFDDPGRDPRGWVVSVAFTVAVPYSRLEPALTGDGSVSLAPVIGMSSRSEPAAARSGASVRIPVADSSPRSEPAAANNGGEGRDSIVAPASPTVEIQLPRGQSELPFDHQIMVSRAVSTLRERYEIRPDPAPAPEPDPDRLVTHRPFTITQLRAVYEAILGRSVQRDAFSRRFAPRTGDRTAAGQLRAVGQTRALTGGRPAQLYDIK
jgi:8-oxo-dGTP diphosphatase